MVPGNRNYPNGGLFQAPQVFQGGARRCRIRAVGLEQLRDDNDHANTVGRVESKPHGPPQQQVVPAAPGFGSARFLYVARHPPQVQLGEVQHPDQCSAPRLPGG